MDVSLLRPVFEAWASLRLLSSLIVEDDADDAAEALAAAAKGFPPKELSVLMWPRRNGSFCLIAYLSSGHNPSKLPSTGSYTAFHLGKHQGFLYAGGRQ